jgi:hypothetical protein
MWAIVENNQVKEVLLNPVPFIVNGVEYPVTAFFDKTSAQLAQIGVYSLVKKKTNNKFYNTVAKKYVLYPDLLEVHEEDVVEANNLHNIKLQLSYEVTQRAANILSQSDWMITRAIETTGARPVPEEILTYREEVRNCSDRKIYEVDQIQTVAEAEKFNPDHGWPVYVAKEKPYSRVEIVGASEERIREVMQRRLALKHYIDQNESKA